MSNRQATLKFPCESGIVTRGHFKSWLKNWCFMHDAILTLEEDKHLLYSTFRVKIVFDELDAKQFEKALQEFKRMFGNE